MSARQLSERCYLALKAASSRLVKLLGGQEAAALSTRVGHQALSSYGSPQKLDLFMPIDAVADLERELGEPIITRALADLAGFDLVARQMGGETTLPRLLPDLLKEANEVSLQLATAIADGQIDERERATLRAEANDAIGVLHRLLAALDRPEATT